MRPRILYSSDPPNQRMNAPRAKTMAEREKYKKNRIQVASAYPT